jgi:transcriptional regulator with GAF, ATPase, and Fis domain
MRTQTDVGRERASVTAKGFALRIVQTPARELIDFLVPIQAPLVVGREPPARDSTTPGTTLAISDPRLSSRHVAIYPAGEGRSGLQFLDLESKNGTYKNCERKPNGRLATGDVLRAGQSLFVATHPAMSGFRESPEDDLVGQSPDLLVAWERAQAGGARGVPVLILGETGTGKEGVARLVHRASGRKGPFIAINCATLAGETATATLFGHERGAFTGAVDKRRGVFGEAEGGTLFLDEIGDLPLEVQPRLLRALEQREVTPLGSARPQRVDVQLVAATHADLRSFAAQGRFRPDLHARLSTWVVELPPLRARREDILRLARSFSGAAPGDALFEAEAAEALLLHPFPYNVRELRQVVTKLAIQAQRPFTLEAVRAALSATSPADTAALDDTMPGTAPRVRRGARPSREELLAALERCEWNVAAVARELERDRKQIYRWAALHGITLKDE